MKDTTTDVGALLDEGPWSAYQKLLVAATALTLIFDGLDNQLLSAAIPALMGEWRLPRPRRLETSQASVHSPPA